MIKLSSTEYETLMPFLGYAPARLQERVIALIGSRPIRAGYSWTEEADGHNHHWQGLAVVGNSVLLVNATAPAYPEHVNGMSLDRRFQRRHLPDLSRGASARRSRRRAS